MSCTNLGAGSHIYWHAEIKTYKYAPL
jgi:hypothetical protein